MAQDLHTMDFSPGHQSEPTTPPEYRDHIFPSIYSRRNRYSSSSLTSPAGINSRNSRSGSQLTSPPMDLIQAQRGSEHSDKLPSKSVPGSRRGSTVGVSSYIPENSIAGQRSTAAYVMNFLSSQFLFTFICIFIPLQFSHLEIYQIAIDHKRFVYTLMSDVRDDVNRELCSIYFLFHLNLHCDVHFENSV